MFDGQINVSNSLMVVNNVNSIGMRLWRHVELFVHRGFVLFLCPLVSVRWRRRGAAVPVHRLPQVLHAEVRAQFARKNTYGPGKTVPVPVVSRRLHLQAIPGDSHAHPYWRAALSVRHLPETLHAEVESQHTQADALSAGPAFPVLAVPCRLHLQAVPRDTQSHAHRRTALPMRRLPQAVRAKVNTQHTQTNAHSARSSVSMHGVPGGVHVQAVPGDTHAHAHGRTSV